MPPCTVFVEKGSGRGALTTLAFYVVGTVLAAVYAVKHDEFHVVGVDGIVGADGGQNDGIQL
jgi:hypothetical protein